jgi:YesN/AraC family two-component response regulator
MELQELVNGCFNISITISISSIGNGPFELSEKTREALEALKYKTALGANSIIIFSELENMYKNVSIIEKNKNEVLDINEDKPKIISATLRRAVEYINNHYQELITLNDVAEYTYLSTYYLSRMFTKELNKNFVDYLNEIRIEKAKEYLKDSRYKTYEIAEMVGIKDPHYFSKLFKKYTGNTPSEYRIQ